MLPPRFCAAFIPDAQGDGATVAIGTCLRHALEQREASRATTSKTSSLLHTLKAPVPSHHAPARNVMRPRPKRMQWSLTLKKIILASLLMSAGCAVQAMADDLATANTLSAPGWYLGLQLGSASAHPSMVEYGSGTTNPNDYTWNGADKASLSGVYLGTNLLTKDKVVMGVEADLGYAHLSDEGLLLDAGAPDSGYLYGWKTGLQGSLRARAGVMAGNALFYVTGGVAMGQQTFKTFEYDSDTNFENNHRTMVGATVGAGIEYAISIHVTARIEYRYTDFGNAKITPNISDYDGNYEDKVNVTQQNLTVGVAYRF